VGRDDTKSLYLARALKEVKSSVEQELIEALAGVGNEVEVDEAYLASLIRKLQRTQDQLVESESEDAQNIATNGERVANQRRRTDKQIDDVNRKLNEIAGSVPLSLTIEAKARPNITLIQNSQFYYNKESVEFGDEHPWLRNLRYKDIKNKLTNFNNWDENIPNYTCEQVYVLPSELGVPIFIAQSKPGMTITEWDALPSKIDYDTLNSDGYSFQVAIFPVYIKDLVGEMRIDKYVDNSPLNKRELVPYGDFSAVDVVLTIIEFALAFTSIVFEGETAGLIAAAVLEAGEIVSDEAMYDEVTHINSSHGPAFGVISSERLQYDGPVVKMINRGGKVTGYEGSSSGRTFGKLRSHRKEIFDSDGNPFPVVLHPDQLENISFSEAFHGWVEALRFAPPARRLDRVLDSDLITSTPILQGGRFSTSKRGQRYNVSKLESRIFRANTHSVVSIVPFEESPFADLDGLDVDGKISWDFEGTLKHPTEYDEEGNALTYDTVFIGDVPYAWFDGAVWQVRDVSELLL
jgi:hypothetical protein